MADLSGLTAQLLARFEALGAARIEAAILQPAETLLDLYGEDIRARAYVTQDPLRGEQMLRPDFTVPVVQMHMDASAEPARYTYAGSVFRRQEQDADRANEYPQVGYEVFDRGAPELVEAEIFAAFYQALEGLSVTPVMGDIAILAAAVDSLETVPARKAALRRHLWRPVRFRDLLDRYCQDAQVREEAVGGPEIGVRSAAEVASRAARLKAEAAVAPLPEAAADQLEAVLDVSGAAPEALAALKALTADLPGIALEVARLEARIDAMSDAGVDVSKVQFEGSYGRTSMEYYDGFVFGFQADGVDQPVATGGRYDALTRALGAGRDVPAVGAVVRPDLMLTLMGAGQ